MKKHSLAEFMKSKSFYALLCVGALAIIAITLVSLNQSSDKEDKKNLVDLNEPIVEEYADNGNEVADDTDNNPSEADANTPSTDNEVASNDQVPDVLENPVTDGSYLEFDPVDDPTVAEDHSNTPVKTDTAKHETPVKEDVVQVPEQEAKEVLNPDTLYFDAEEGLSWPVSGNILMDYSADKVVFFQTLQQFKCNPAIIIDAKVGTEVKSAADGIITSITNEAETGTTVTVNIGSGYSLVYGQLDEDINVKVGDQVFEGDVIGKVAEPTMYYSVEGSNLYFQVLKDDETVNPMLLLK